MTTYANGKRIRYPKAGDWVRRENEEKGLVTSVDVDGSVCVSFDGGDDVCYQPDVLVLHRSGWYFYEPEPEPPQRGWGG